MKIKYTVIIQARLGSTRFPNKMIKKIGNQTIIEILLKRLKQSRLINNIILATTKKKNDDKLDHLARKNKIQVFRGSEENVLERFYKASKSIESDYLIRICGDCPLLDPTIIDKLIKINNKKKFDYLSNINPPTFPDGFDVEIFSKKILKEAYLKAKSKYDKEHVTPYIIRKAKSKFNLKNSKDSSNLRLTIDEEKDFLVIKKIIKNINKKWFSLSDVIKLKKQKPEIFKINQDLKRNEGSILNKGQKLWSRAKNIIPGGNMLLSKRPEMFLPGKWPTYFTKADGCYVWDLENKKYLDFSTMSVGTNILGYANKNINSEIIRTVKRSNMSSLNAPEEVYLAEKLIDMHPQFDMVRYAKTGGEANAIAIRIARAASGKDNIAICGYHGWHDWYLAANIKNNKNLNTHLLPGLSPAGVPKKLKNTTFPFEYNDIKTLKKLVKKEKIGIIKLEVFRNIKPKRNFLREVRDIANKNNIILIFDECTSGFRETFGALHKKYKIYPDICILGKAIANGYPLTVIMGKRKIMQHAQNTFISSTFWTDKIGFVAGLKTLKEMEKNKSWITISKTGKIIKKQWIRIAKKNKINLSIFGLDALPAFSIKSKNWIKYKTYISQEMLKNNILASNLVFVSISHHKKEIKRYIKNLDNIFKKIKQFEDGLNIDNYLSSPTCHTGFKRLN